jgi:hypothetical protein
LTGPPALLEPFVHYLAAVVRLAVCALLVRSAQKAAIGDSTIAASRVGVVRLVVRQVQRRVVLH